MVLRIGSMTLPLPKVNMDQYGSNWYGPAIIQYKFDYQRWRFTTSDGGFVNIDLSLLCASAPLPFG